MSNYRRRLLLANQLEDDIVSYENSVNNETHIPENTNTDSHEMLTETIITD